MSISTDTKLLDSVSQFAVFIEILRHPEKLDEALRNIKTASDEYQTKLGLINTKEEADNYLDKAKQTLDEANGFIEKKTAELETDYKARVASLEATTKAAQVAKDKYETLAAKAQQDVDAAKVAESKASDLLGKAVRDSLVIENKMKSLSEFEASLNEKKKKLTELLG